jgi:hypothetical protein
MLSRASECSDYVTAPRSRLELPCEELRSSSSWLKRQRRFSRKQEQGQGYLARQFGRPNCRLVCSVNRFGRPNCRLVCSVNRFGRPNCRLVCSVNRFGRPNCRPVCSVNRFGRPNCRPVCSVNRFGRPNCRPVCSVNRFGRPNCMLICQAGVHVPLRGTAGRDKRRIWSSRTED